MTVTSQKINILHLRDSPWVDGPGRTIIETAAAIDGSRFNYIIGGFTNSLHAESPLVEAALKRDLRAVSIRERSAFDMQAFRQILDVVEAYNIQIIDTHEVRSDLIGLICARIAHVKVIATLHGWIPNGLSGKMRVVLDKSLLHFFDRIIVVSEKMKQQVLQLRVPERKVSLLHNCIIAERYRRDPLDSRFRQELGLDKNAVLVGKIGRLSPEKGQADLLRAARSIVAKHDNVKFILVGTGPDQRKLEDLAERTGIRDSVLFTGYRTDMQHVYNSLDLVIQTSYTEGLPNVILESLLMEVPVIATDVGGTSAVVVDERTGMLIRPRSAEVIADAIERYIRNPAYFQAMAKAGRKHVERNFDFSARTSRIETIYRELVNSRKDH